MNQQEMKSVAFLIAIFILGGILVGVSFEPDVVNIRWYMFGFGLFLMAVSGLFIWREVTD